eukprot:353939-Chlamydomonas_euryale.AAC.11
MQHKPYPKLIILGGMHCSAAPMCADWYKHMQPPSSTPHAPTLSPYMEEMAFRAISLRRFRSALQANSRDIPQQPINPASQLTSSCMAFSPRTVTEQEIFSLRRMENERTV